ncbi:MAG: Short-chain-enoyl-CoA hydratase [Alphaproteobacteria bacterium MarineAlpha9_Bin4]|nr:MAG: Short-chain-enoyl-CoA hydratase [Alphaproteobacteria bacterium MarineAlpha9_Bin4]
MNDIHIEKLNSTIIITLAREKVLNALNLNMVREIFKHIYEWEKDNSISGIIIKGAGEKSFCAGGDIVSVYKSKDKKENNLSDIFFREEYILNLAIAEFSKPWISILNGIAMGGGLGLSVHGSHRIVNNKTITAMPETAIGLFPDVGGGFFLSKMKSVGTYLALTGKTMNGLDSMYVGIGTHYLEDNIIKKILDNIINKPNYNADYIDNLLNKNSKLVFEEKSSIEKNTANIEKHFNKDSLIQIFESLKKDDSEWANSTLEILSKKSPTSMSVTVEQLVKAKKLSLKDCLKMEFRICQAMMAKHDFYEGVRANLVDKDRNPKWNPNNIYDIKESLIKEHFVELGQKDLFENE